MNLFKEVWEANASHERLVRILNTDDGGKSVSIQSCEPDGRLIEDGLIVSIKSPIFLKLYHQYVPEPAN